MVIGIGIFIGIFIFIGIGAAPLLLTARRAQPQKLQTPINPHEAPTKAQEPYELTTVGRRSA